MVFVRVGQEIMRDDKGVQTTAVLQVAFDIAIRKLSLDWTSNRAKCHRLQYFSVDWQCLHAPRHLMLPISRMDCVCASKYSGVAAWGRLTPWGYAEQD
jgi:hypothetical protein